MICCDNCAAWQHNECMEIPDKLPEGEQYFCEQCRPDLHKELLAKVERGEKPWEERTRLRELEKSKGRKGKGKKGKRGRPSKTNGATNDADVSHVDETSEMVQEAETPTIENNKRKLIESAEDIKSPTQAVSDPPDTFLRSLLTLEQEPPSKTRKVSIPPSPKTAAPNSRRKSGAPGPVKRDSAPFRFQTELVEKVSDIENPDRRPAAGAIVKLFQDETKKAIKSGSFSLPEGQVAEEFGLRIGLSVEFAMYMNYWGMENKPDAPYSDKFRMVLANVKQNPSLRDQLLTGSLSANAFAKMSSEDMASKELKEQKAEMLKEAEKQSMIVQDEGPRIRRTHKGEELVDDGHQVAEASDAAFTAPIRKRPSEIDTTMKDASPEPFSAISPAAVELPETAVPTEPKEPLTINTQSSPQPSAAPASANKFDIHNVWSTVKTPDTETQRNRQAPRASDASAPPQPQEADADIDRLLKEEEADDDEPYSPAEYSTLPGGSVWSGKLTMPGVASFNGIAKHCAGADLSSTVTWNALIPSTLNVEGRIDIDRASQYLCGLKWSHTSDVVVVAVTPESSEENTLQFNKLFDYFKQRNRYGVVGKSSNTIVRDTYVVPLEAGSSKKPDFIELLDVCTIDDPTTERLLLLGFVVKLSSSPSANQTPRPSDAASISSPINATGPPHPNFHNAPAPAMPFQPIPQHFGPQSSPPQGQVPYSAPQGYPPPYLGMEAARFALGDLANRPAVAQLVREAPRSGVPEFLAVKTILDRNPSLGDDFGTLVSMMGQELARRQQGQP